MSSSQQQAFEVCERYVKDWAPSYAHHTRLVREVVGISTFTTVWSKPTKEKPISDILANVTVTVDLFGEVPSVSHALDSGFTSFTRQLRMEKVIEWHMADKRRVREVLRDIDHDRLQRPQPYVPVLHAPDSVAATQPPSSPAEGPGEEAGEASKPPLHAEAGLLTENDLELEAMLIKLFRDADADKSGSLDPTEFYSLFQTAELGLSKSEVAFLLSEADISGDGLVQYSEFVPVAVDVIQSLRLRYRAADEMASAQELATDEAVTALHGLSKEQLEVMMQDVFQAADENGDGQLSRVEFAVCLERVRLGPTRLSMREIRYFLAVVESNEDGGVSYEAFLPVAWDLLVETLKSNYLASSQGDLFDYLRDLCEHADRTAGEGSEGRLSGKLTRDDIKEVLTGADRIKLTSVQVYTVLAEAEEDEESRVEYGAFLLRAAPLIQSMCSPILEKQRQEALLRAKLTPVDILGGVEREAMNAKLHDVFNRYDADKNGFLSRAEFGKCLRSADLQLTPPQIAGLFSATDADVDGNISLDEFVASAYDKLLTLAREKALQQEMHLDATGETLGGAARLLLSA